VPANRLPGPFLTPPSAAHGATVTFLLRSLSVFDNDEAIKPYVSSGKARLVQGDALVAEDVANAWAKAAEGEHANGVDFVLFSIGKALRLFLSPKTKTDLVAVQVE
jgi:hypothetical protein